MSFANSTINSTTITDKTKQEVFAFVTSELQKQVELVPNDARYQLFTGVTFGSYHLWEQGLPFLLRAEKLSPNKQTIKMEIVSNYLNQGKMAEALAEAKATFDLAPDFREARIIYAITLFYNKQNALAENILVGAKDSTVFQDNRVMSAYLSNGGLEPSIKELRKQISASPKDLSLRYKLVNIYISANKKTEAIVEIENMVKIDPTLRDQADAYIKQLQGK
jgi:thioredoxin-like negative regulator of GroEL